MEKYGLVSKRLFFKEYSRTLGNRELYYYSFNPDMEPLEEVDYYFDLIIKNYGERHVPIYRLCDGEYIYLLGARIPHAQISFLAKGRIVFRRVLSSLGVISHRNWHGETYTGSEKRRLKKKLIMDLQSVAKDGFMAPHLLLSEDKFCEEYNIPIVRFFNKNKIHFHRDNFFPFYFVYVILSLKRYKERLFKGKSVLVITSFNRRKRKESFEAEFRKEGAGNIYFYEISATKSMMEVIDQNRLPETVDLVLVGAGIGSANIINQLTKLKAICIDAGHALECFSEKELRMERICLYPDEMTLDREND